MLKGKEVEFILFLLLEKDTLSRYIYSKVHSFSVSSILGPLHMSKHVPLDGARKPLHTLLDNGLH